MRFRFSYYLLIILVLPLLFVLQNPRINAPLHRASLTVLKPALMGGHVIASTISGTWNKAVQFWNSFQNEGIYEKQVQELKAQLLYYHEAMRENERLKSLLAFKDTVPSKTIAARIIGWDLSPWRKTAILDKGKLQGLKKDMIVMVPAGLVGRILEVNPTTSRLILLVDSDARVSAVAENSQAQGVVFGDGSTKLSMKYLDLDSGVAVGETVLTSGVGRLYPRGLGIGKIESIGKDSNGLHLDVAVEPFVQFSKLEEVLCLEYFQAE
ncbi:MAG: rod shape-determining protein MreC [Candidatus Omnitrophica bacterium]|nr:rod shape-determining protein MreC [Candidatus Omnitrophota bacterium]